MDGQGGPEYVCLLRDLTQAKRMEEERWRLREAIQRQAIVLEELSTPLIPLTDEVLVMPLIGSLDEQRIAQLTETLLRGVVYRQARVAIVDITGVRTIDEQAILGINRAVQAVRLVGAGVVLTGISPDVASTLVQLEVDLTGVVTFGSLQRGIVYAMQLGKTPPNGAAVRRAGTSV
jgi:rsbT co-antagonist protein RsbR